MTLTTEIVTEKRRFDDLRQPWDRLWHRSNGFIFQHHAWIAGWLTGIRDRRGIKLQISLVWDGDRLCGAMPFAVHRRSGVRVLCWAAELFSDYCDCLLDAENEAATILSLLWGSMQRFGGFDIINLKQVRPDAKCREFLDQLPSTGSRLQPTDRIDRCLRVENRWRDGEAFFRSLNKKARNNHTRGKRILSELGGDVHFRMVEPPDPSAARLLDQIIRLKQDWLRVNDPDSALLGEDQDAQRLMLDSAWNSGLAKIFVLACGESIVALSVNFVYGGRMEAYFTAYDCAFERASPGTILIVDYARWSFDRGLRHVDFLRGEQAFKFRMANAETSLSGFSGTRTVVGQIAASGHRWLSRFRQQQDTTRQGVDDEELQPAG